MKVKVKVKSLSRVRLFATPWTAAHQAPPPMGFSGQEDWSGVPSPLVPKWPPLTPQFNYPKETYYLLFFSFEKKICSSSVLC